MFYSETLLSKSGALARVWLSANLEKKLSKKDIRDTNIESSVSAIVDQGQAPLALRLSGQLLLGVVRIYSRKTRYLLDDCNEAINKIKMTFRTGNNDRPANESHALNPASLTMADVLTEIDLNAPFGDPSLLFGSQLDTSLLLGSSQHLDRSVNGSRAGSVDPAEGSTFGVGSTFATPVKSRQIEVGRDAPLSMSRLETNNDSLVKFGGDDEDDLQLDLGMDMPIDQEPDLTIGGYEGGLDGLDHNAGLNDMTGDDGDAMDIDGQQENPQARERTESPLSSARSSVEPTMHQPASILHQTEEDEASVHAPQRVKRRKILEPDNKSTTIRSNEIQDAQTNHAGILRPATFLPQDPLLMRLMEMQRNGEFVSNILGDGRSRGWAPQLRGILSLEVIRQQPLKRKRDTLAARASQQESTPALPEIEIPQDDDLGGIVDSEIDINGPSDENGMTLNGAGQDDMEQQQGDMDDGFDGGMQDNTFDETSIPLLHPAESGPVSQGTKHAVHLLRDKFGAEAADSPGKRLQSSVLFQDLLPEKTTTRADATKMFFEILVLATKDAVKVEQSQDELGGSLQVRAKRGLWGAWAELEAGGEIDTEAGTVEVAS